MDFEDIRPYKDEEVVGKIQKLIEEEQFQQVIQHVIPEIPYAIFKQQLLSISTVREFQAKVVVPLLDKLLAKSAKGLSFSGLENLEKGKNYLFISTHRDIVLDSALMNYILLKEGFETAEIAIGDNLMKIPWVVDLVKLNKTFIVKRNLPKEQKVAGSLQLSGYINHTIQEKGESIWIAQRSGRSKNGDDRTNPSILKMFNLKGKNANVIDNLRDLEICPVSISYEFNPCDVLTMPELLMVAKGEKYEKEPMEDMLHMAQGIEGNKGRIEVSFGKPLNSSLDELAEIQNKNELLSAISQRIDDEIHSTYKLMPTNYIAFDLLKNTSEYQDHYSAQEKEEFQNYMQKRLANVDAKEELKSEIFLSMYANPVINKIGLQ